MPITLSCPHCHSTAKFLVGATMNVTVDGLDCFRPVEHAAITDIEYGSLSPCQCPACAYLATFSDFAQFPEGVIKPDDDALASYAPRHAAKCVVYPIRRAIDPDMEESEKPQ